MGGEGCVSDGRGGEGVCGAGAADARRLRGRRRGGGGAASPPRALTSHEMVPARASEQKCVREARATATGAGPTSATGSSEPPPLVSVGGDGRASGTGLGLGGGGTFWRGQNIDHRNVASAAKSTQASGESEGKHGLSRFGRGVGEHRRAAR